MITADRGHVRIDGEETECLANFSAIIKAFKIMLTETHGADTAHELIARAGRLAFMTDAELEAELENERREPGNDKSE